VREKARQTSCLSNQKQITLAILMYARVHSGRSLEGRHACGPFRR